MPRDDAAWMRRCLAVALKGRGRVSPNPMVGAILVRGGRLVAEAFHARYGGDHAEAAALRKAGRAARGATLYVSLEPCAHHGKTPPCTDAVIRAGVRRVVAAMKDPHPLVNGRGFRALRGAGVKVQSGLLRGEAVRLNLAYLKALRTGRPLVTLKAGMTLDGRIATAGGESRWITSGVSRRDAHRMRAAHDAVLVGIGTALHDAPRLDARGRERRARQPLRVILDSGLRLDPSSRTLRVRGGGEVLLYHAAAAPARRRALERAGASVVRAGRGPGGVSLEAVLRDLARRGVHSLLVEGGARVAWSFLSQGLADRVVLYVAPFLVGGERSVPVVGGRGVERLAEAFRLVEVETRMSGPDIRISGWLAPLRASRGSRRARPGRPAILLRRNGP